VSSAIVRVEGLVRRFGATTAVDGLSFEVRTGEMFGLIGPDGAGKTTTLRTILGLARSDAGRVETCGMDPVRDRRRLAMRVGYLAQRFSLYGDLSVDENVAFSARVHGVRGFRARREELLDRLGLGPFRGRLAERLSGGMKQKLALACTLVHTPELLVLDEPTTGVDPVARRDFWKILRQLEHEGLSILVTTPYLDEAERCDRVGLVDHGRLLDLATPHDLRAGFPGTMVEILARPRRDAATRLSARAEVVDVQSFGERLHAYLPAHQGEAALAAARALAEDLSASGIEVESARPVLPTLEDVFIARVRARSPRHRDEVAP
jgi:ABC-2 type transport system ATP-binding protein